MKSLLSSLLLLVGLNKILGRYVDNQLYVDSFHNDYYTFLGGESSDDSEETKETLISSTNGNSDEIGDFLGILLGSILPASDEDTFSNDRVDEFFATPDNVARDYSYNQLFYNPSSEKSNFGKEEDESSEENLNSFSKGDKSTENSDEVITSKTVEVETIDLTKSSEEEKDQSAVDISKQNIHELSALLIALGAIDIVNRYPDYIGDDTQDNELGAKEDDEYLNLFYIFLNEKLKQNKEDNYNNDEDDETNDFTTPQNDSDEENDSSGEKTTTPTIDSDKENNDDDDDNKNDYYDNTDDNSKSDSNENEFNIISLTFHGLDDADQHININDHKYEIVETSPVLKPTSAPHMTEFTSLSTSNDNNVIYEYNGIREDLDTQETNLLENQRFLDQDFYTVISSNYDDESISKFEKDIIVVHENLDRIKRNINAMENLHSKLYFHKLITAAVKEVQKKSN